MRRSLLFLIPVILLWATTPLLVAELSAQLPVYQINALAASFALIVLALGLTLFRQWGTLARYPGRDRIRMLLLGAACIFPYIALYYLALSLAPSAAGEVNIINYLWPIWVLVLSGPLLKERLGWRGVLSVLLGFIGVYLLASGGRLLQFRTEHWQAYLCAGSGAFFWGLFSVLSKRQRFEPLPAMFLYNLGVLACFTLGSAGLRARACAGGFRQAGIAFAPSLATAAAPGRRRPRLGIPVLDPGPARRRHRPDRDPGLPDAVRGSALPGALPGHPGPSPAARFAGLDPDRPDSRGGPGSIAPGPARGAHRRWAS